VTSGLLEKVSDVRLTARRVTPLGNH